MTAAPPVAQAHASPAGYGEFLASLLGDRERFFEAVVDGAGLSTKLRQCALTIVVLAGFFGGVAGAYSGPLQAISSAVKLPFLLFASFAICFPAFYVVQVLVGSRLKLAQVAVLVLAALALTSVLLAAFVPITAFFLVTGANYYFQHLLNIALAAVAGVFGMYALSSGLSLVCEKRGVYPRKGVTIMRAWALLLAFVGIQLAWSLRPFLGDRSERFQVFGDYEGNFYAAVVYSINQLLQGNGGAPAPSSAPDTTDVLRSLLGPGAESAAGERRP
jgi:hypothetical protein